MRLVLLAALLVASSSRRLRQPTRPTPSGPTRPRPAPPRPTDTVLGIAAASADLTTFVALARGSGLDAVLRDTARTLTVFAPSNAAFDALGADALAALRADPAALRARLAGHVLDYRLLSARRRRRADGRDGRRDRDRPRPGRPARRPRRRRGGARRHAGPRRRQRRRPGHRRRAGVRSAQRAGRILAASHVLCARCPRAALSPARRRSLVVLASAAATATTTLDASTRPTRPGARRRPPRPAIYVKGSRTSRRAGLRVPRAARRRRGGLLRGSIVGPGGARSPPIRHATASWRADGRAARCRHRSRVRLRRRASARSSSGRLDDHGRRVETRRGRPPLALGPPLQRPHADVRLPPRGRDRLRRLPAHHRRRADRRPRDGTAGRSGHLGRRGPPVQRHRLLPDRLRQEVRHAGRRAERAGVVGKEGAGAKREGRHELRRRRHRPAASKRFDASDDAAGSKTAPRKATASHVARPAAPASAGRGDDGGEARRVQARPADERAVDVGLREERRGVVGLDAAAVEQRDGAARLAEALGEARTAARRASPAPAPGSPCGRSRWPTRARRPRRAGPARRRRRATPRVGRPRRPRPARRRAPRASRRRTARAPGRPRGTPTPCARRARCVSPMSARRSECPTST